MGRAGQSLHSPHVGDVQRAIVGRGKTWGSVDSRGRGGRSREARAVVGDGDVHAGLELALQLVDALTKMRNH